MPQERVYTGIILKRMLYRETDELLTVFTKEVGKVRVLARGIKKPASKLQSTLQTMYEVQLVVSGRGDLPTIIGATVQNTFTAAREDVSSVGNLYVIAELLLKATGDEEQNIPLYELCIQALVCMQQHPGEGTTAVMCAFLLRFLSVLGMQMRLPSSESITFYFNAALGGFTDTLTAGGIIASPHIAADIVRLSVYSFENIHTVSISPEVQQFIMHFVEYQLERKVRSAFFL